MGRRVNGEGSVYRVADGGGWMAAVSFVDVNTGKQRRRRKRARTKQAALDALRVMQSELEDYGQPPDPNRLVKTTVNDYLRVREHQDRRQGTVVADEWAASLIIAGLGDLRTDQLTVADCDRFLEAAAAGTYSGQLGKDRLRRLRGRLISALDNDRRRGLVRENPAKLSIVPRVAAGYVPRRPARALTMSELQALIDTSRGAIQILVDLSGRHGLRPAEARAVRWSKLDLDLGTIRIDRQMDRNGQLVPVKTKRAERTIRIDANTMDRLRRWKDLQDEAEKVESWLGNPLNLVATTRHGTPLGQRNIHRSLTKLSKKLGIEPNVSGYDLRHTAITFQVDKGHPAHHIADWAGTSEKMISEVYRHKLNEISDLGPSDES